MKKNRAYKFRMYPTEAQEVLIQKTFGCCRFIYNKMLGDKISHYRETGKSLNNTPAQYKKEFVWLREVDSLALANTQLNLQSAYNNFFRDKKVGFPKFKSKKRDQKNYTTNNQNGTIRVIDNCIRLPKLGNVKCVFHRDIPANYILKSATISQTPTLKYYVSLLFEYEEIVAQADIDKNKAIGIDYKSNGFGVTSDGEILGEHRYYRESQAKLSFAQRKISKKKRNSKNYNKQKLKIAKIHEHITNQRKDFAHKLSFELSEKYDIVCLEDIDLQNISQSLKLGKSTNDNGFGMFRAFLNYKLADRGKHLVKIGKWEPTSTVCSECGAYHKDIVNSLSVREWVCPDCKTHHDRDINAAKNILNLGLSKIE